MNPVNPVTTHSRRGLGTPRSPWPRNRAYPLAGRILRVVHPETAAGGDESEPIAWIAVRQCEVGGSPYAAREAFAAEE